MRRFAVALCAIISFAVPSAGSHAQQQAATRDCDAGAARRQLTGQPMTDFLAACRAARVNPENLGRICASAADSNKLSGTTRDSYMRECTTGPD